MAIDEAGNAISHYPVTDEVDIRNIRAGVRGQLIRIHEAAGAGEIVGSARTCGDWCRGEDLEACRRRRHLAADRAARVRALLRAPDGLLPDGNRSRELGRRPARRAARRARGLDRRRERLPEPVGHQPDADDHGAGATDRAARSSPPDSRGGRDRPGRRGRARLRGARRSRRRAAAAGDGPRDADDRLGRALLCAARRARLPGDPVRQPRRRPLELDGRAAAAPARGLRRRPAPARLHAHRDGRRRRRAARPSSRSSPRTWSAPRWEG